MPKKWAVIVTLFVNQFHQEKINQSKPIKIPKSFLLTKKTVEMTCKKCTFSSNIYKLLNKNLSFVPTPKQYSQEQPNTDIENVFRLLNLRVHFKDANETQTSDQLYQPSKFKNKAKWTPK